MAIAIAQYLQDRNNSITQDSANATVIAYLGAQLEVQKQNATLEANTLKNGPEATQNTQDLAAVRTAQAGMNADYLSALATLTAIPKGKGFALFDLLSPRATPVPPVAAVPGQAIEVATPLPATPQENLPSQSPYRLISFLNPDGSQSLIEGWSWEPATSNDNAYRISSGGEVLTVISGPGTNLARSNVTAPLAAYPLSGDFQVKVKLQFTGNA